MEQAEAILQELDTHGQRLAHLALRYESEHPDLLQDYTLTILLYVKEYNLGGRNVTIDNLIRMAVDGELDNFSTIHRTQTDAKKFFQTPEQRRKAIISEEAGTEALRVKAKGWDG